MPIELLTQNISAKSRHEELEGEDYLVVPMVMLTEGVHRGNNGSLYYPAKELRKTPEHWNHKPIVIYHPTKNGSAVSACSQDVLNNRKVGLILNTKWDGKAKKLRAEAWLKTNRLQEVDARVMQAIEQNKMMEVSTGVFTDHDPTSGEWNGEEYDAIAVNYRADHLAILPDQKGACSIEDGAGLLQINQMSHSDIRETLAGAMREKHGDSLWIMDVFDEFFVFELEGKFYRMAYASGDASISVTGEAVQVARVTSYKAIPDGQVIANSTDSILFSEEISMTKKKLVDALIANKATAWEEKDRETLNGLDVKVLQKMAPPTTNRVPDEDEDEEDEVVDDDIVDDEPEANHKPRKKPTENAAKKAAKKPAKQTQNGGETSVEEYIAQAPLPIRELLHNSMTMMGERKRQLVGIVLNHAENEFDEEELAAMDIGLLERLAKLAGKKPAKQTQNGGDEGDVTHQNIPLYYGVSGGASRALPRQSQTQNQNYMPGSLVANDEGDEEPLAMPDLFASAK
jgi:hypothetical protein